MTPTRTRSSFSRAVATWVAMLTALLLIGSTGPVYAADGGGDTAATTSQTDTTSSDTTTDTTDTTTDSTATDTPTADPTDTPTTDPTTTPPAPTTTKTTTKQSTTSTFTALSSGVTVAALALVAPIADTGNFEIDGDTVVNHGGNDWAQYPGALADESYRDAQGYQGTNKQEDDPSGWSGAQVATEKMDMVKLWVKTLPPGPRGVFGIQRDAANGTTAYFFEYNQLPNLPGDVAKPDRQPNDVMFAYQQSGNNAGNKLSFVQGYVYVLKSSTAWNEPGTSCTPINNSSPAGGWCTLKTNDGVFYGATSDGTGTDGYAEGIFAEGVVDFSKLNFPAGTCRGALGTLNVRSQASLEWTSAMQDFAVADVQVDPTCGSLTIQKKGLAGDALVPGAIFSIVDDPRPGETGTYTVFDGTAAQLATINASSNPAPAGTVADGAADGKIKIPSVDPDTYTVTELRAPDGYLLPADRDQVVSVGAAGTTNANQTIDFRDPKQWAAPTVTKTAAGTFDAAYAWSIKKYVASVVGGVVGAYQDDSLEQDVASGDTATFRYKVTATEGAQTLSNYRVAGEIRVSNTNDANMSVNLADTLSGGGTCTINGGTTTVSVPPNPSGTPYTAYPYSCVPTSHTAGTNTATVGWSKATYPQTQADVDATNPGTGSNSTGAVSYSYSVDKETNKTVAITDDHHDFGTWSMTWTGEGVSETKTYDVSPTVAAGTCSPVVDNTAFVESTTDTTPAALPAIDSDSASRQLCVGADLTVAKNATTSLTRTYLWTIDKTTSTPKVNTDANGNATANYSVTVARAPGDGYADSGWQMSGVITVTNPNDWEAVTLTGVTDAYSGGGTCDVTQSRANANAAWDASINYVVPKAGSYQYGYTCTFTTKPGYNGTNTATATWSATAAHTPTGTDDGFVGVTEGQWSQTAVNKTITVSDDHFTGGTGTGGHVLGTLNWDNAPHTYTYSVTWTGTPGSCVTRTNTATIVETKQSDTADVSVCESKGLSASKDADATFVRTYDWSIDKQITDPATVHVDSYSHSFDYTVTVTPNGSSDGGWALSGDITVTNLNTPNGGIDPITADISDAPVGVGGGVTCTVDDPEITLASGETEVVGYSCDFTGTPNATGGKNVATVTWGTSGSTTGETPVTFTMGSEVNKTVNVYDDQVTAPAGVFLGTATWDQPKTFTYSKSFTAPSAQCTPFTNTAWVNGDDGKALDTAQATATICPNAGTWKLSKTSSTDPTPLLPGGTITYTLTVTHVSGVDAKNLVVTDNLANVLDDASFGSVLGVVPAGQSVVTPPGGAGTADDNQLTWDIDTLAPGDSESLAYTVNVDSDAWNATLTNVATPGTGGTCVQASDCTTTNHTPPQPTLTLVKSVDDNGTGANDTPNEWTLSALQGQSTVFSGASGSAAVTAHPVNPGTYTFDESGPTGYTPLGWDCTADGQTNYVTSVTLAAGQDKTCTVTNQAIKPHLTLVKALDKTADPGAPGVPADWHLVANNAGTTGVDVEGDGTAQKDVVVGRYDLSESPNASAPTGYDNGNNNTWACKTPTGADATMTDKDTVTLTLGENVTCTIVNTVTKGTWSRSKSSTPGDGATVEPGDSIIYKLTATRNSGGSDPRDISLVDDLTNVWAHATYNGITDADGNSIATPAGVTEPTAGDKTLTWHIDTLSSTQVLYFKVTVNAGQFGTSFDNVVTGTGSTCLTDCDTVHYTPAYSLAKSSSPAEGSLVAPDTDVDYTLTVKNTTDHATLADAVVTDNLSNVVNHTSDPDILSGTGGSYANGTLTWNVPTLAPGATATLVYRVHIDADAFGVTIGNVATPKADTGGNCVPPTQTDAKPCETTHHTKDMPTLTLVKDVNNGTTAGDAVPHDFTLTATPTDVPDAGSMHQTAVSGPGGGDGQVVNESVLPGTYQLDETNVAHYTQGLWECRATGSQDAWTPAGTMGAKGSVSLSLDEDTTCRVTNTADNSSWTIAKTSDQDGQQVLPDSLVTYELTAKWAGGVQLKNTVVRDDITDVLDDATLQGSLPAGAVLDTTTVPGKTFIVWTIPVLADTAADRTHTLSYTVKVDHDAWNATLHNVVTPGSPNGTCEQGNDCTTTTTTPKLPKLTLVKDMEQGIGTPTAGADDWVLSATPGSGVDEAQDTESGAGGFAATPVWPGSYSLAEADNPAEAADGVTSDYSAGDWSCVDNTTQTSTPFPGLDGSSVTLAPNQDVTCTIVNTRIGRWTVTKTNDPGDGATVVPGESVQYTLTVTHTAGVNPTGIVIHDDLSDVLDDATMVTAFPAAGGAATLGGADNDQLTWDVPDFGEGTVQTLSYVVQVNADAKGVSLTNFVTSDSPGSNCPPLSAVTESGLDCSTTNPVPAWTLDKDSDPATGDIVDGGQDIDYTLTVDNTSDAVLSGATVVDDLSAVLNNAVLDQTSFMVNGAAAPAGAVSFDSTTNKLTWHVPDIAPAGDPATLTYTVTVNATFPNGTFFQNVSAPGPVTGEDGNPVNGTGSCVAEGECSTQQGTAVVSPPPPVTPNPPKHHTTPPQPAPPAGPTALPNTGGPNGWYLESGIGLLILGAGLLLGQERRRRQRV